MPIIPLSTSAKCLFEGSDSSPHHPSGIIRALADGHSVEDAVPLVVFGLKKLLGSAKPAEASPFLESPDRGAPVIYDSHEWGKQFADAMCKQCGGESHIDWGVGDTLANRNRPTRECRFRNPPAGNLLVQSRRVH